MPSARPLSSAVAGVPSTKSMVSTRLEVWSQ